MARREVVKSGGSVQVVVRGAKRSGSVLLRLVVRGVKRIGEGF